MIVVSKQIEQNKMIITINGIKMQSQIRNGRKVKVLISHETCAEVIKEKT